MMNVEIDGFIVSANGEEWVDSMLQTEFNHLSKWISMTYMKDRSQTPMERQKEFEKQTNNAYQRFINGSITEEEFDELLEKNSNGGTNNG